MKPELQAIFDSTPADPPRSRLEAYCELILRWRRQGRTYRRICQLLQEQCSVTVSRQVLTRFIERRSRPRKPQTEAEAQLAAHTPAPLVSRTTPNPTYSPAADDPYAEQRERMRRHKEEPPPQPKRKAFEPSEEDLDITKPIRMS